MKIIQMLRGTFAKKPELADGQMYLAKDTKQVFVGDKAIDEGEIELAEKGYVGEIKNTVLQTQQSLASTKRDVTNLTTEVNNQASDIADIQADYAQTAGGNTVTANGVVISDSNGKLKSVTGKANQIVQFNSSKVPVAVDADFADTGLSNVDITTSFVFSGGPMIGGASANWRAMAYDGKDTIVAIAYNSNVAVYYKLSTRKWATTTLPATKNWKAVAYGAGKFVAIGENTNVTAYSTDGITWVQGTILTASQNWQDIAYGGGKFVAISSSQTQAYSTDGITWTLTTQTISNQLVSVAYGDGKFIAVGKSSIGYLTSVDGITWTSVDFTVNIPGYFTSICYGNQGFMAVTSTKTGLFIGRTIATPDLPSDEEWSSVVAIGNNYVAMTKSSNIIAYSSYPSRDWTKDTIANKTGTWYAMVGAKNTAYMLPYGDQFYLSVDANNFLIDNDIATETYVDSKIPDTSDLASKSDLDSYLPLSGGTMTGNIQSESEDFYISTTNYNNGFAQIQMNKQARGILLEATEGNSSLASLSIEGNDEEKNVSFVVKTDDSNYVRVKLYDNDIAAYAYIDDIETYFSPISENSIVTKGYLINEFGADFGIDIIVSETQPTTQKAGDFWYQVTGTV